MADIPLPISLQEILDAQDPAHLIIRRDAEGMDDIELPVLLIPNLVKLKGDDNLMEWKESVRGTFSTNQLTCFIDNDPMVPAATASLKTRVRYLRDRGKAHQLLRASVEPIIDILQSYGWKDVADRPQALYDLAIRAVSRVTDEAWCTTLDNFVSLDATKFDSLRAFMTHYNMSLKKLSEVGITFNDKTKQGLIIKALKRYDDTWVTYLKYQLNSGDLTYNKLITQVQARANEQSGTFIMPAITDGILCKDTACGKYHGFVPKHPFHQRCGQHHSGGDDSCFLLHPELRNGGRDRGNNVAPNRAVLTFDSNVMNGINSRINN